MRNSSRRRFIKHTLIGATGIAVLPVMQSCKVAASDKIRIGVIGLGQQARNLMQGFARIDGVQVVAGADVYGIKRQRFEKILGDFYAERDEKVEVKTYADYNEILDRQDIDAVVIATPDHWHAIQAIAAAKAGKDIYLEKPITFSIKESLAVVKAVRENDIVLAVGSQQRSDNNFQHAVKLAQNGGLGDLEKIYASVGPPPSPYNLPEEPIPGDLDWETWLGPMPFVHYNSRLNPPITLDPPTNETFWAEWRYFKETGGGFTCDWGAHNFDIGQWGAGMNESGPTKIIPAGFEGTEFQTFEYSNGVIMTNQPFDEDGGKGVKFIGTDAWVSVWRGGIAASDDSLLPGDADDANAGLKYESGTGHLGNFIDCIRSRQDPIANIETGQRTVATSILGNIAHELGRPVQWDPAKQYFVNDPEAEKFYHRAYREGYTL
jgi:predicted dehydrogenase